MSDALDRLERSIFSNDEHLPDEQQTSSIERHPRAYQIFLTCTALIGYTFIFGLPILGSLLLALIPNQIISAADYISVSVIFIELGIVIIAFSLSAALYQLKIALPAGRPLSDAEAPKLFALIKELNKELLSQKFQPRIQHVKISQHYEITTHRTPTNGFPLFFTNTLVIGLPLLQSHSPKQIKTLISREIIHLSGSRLRLSSWLFFAGKYWQQYNNALKKQVITPNIFLLFFFSWYAPLYKLFAQEVENIETHFVDDAIAKNSGLKNIADTLAHNYIVRKFLYQSFWPHLNNKAYRHKTPPYLPYSSLERNLKSELDSLTSQSWLDSITLDRDESQRSPDLLARLKKLNVTQPSLPEHHQVSAAQYFLSDTLAKLIKQMDKLWLVSNQFTWQKKYQKGQTEITELKELGIQAKQSLLSDDRMWDYIQLIKRYIDKGEAIKLYKQILQMDTRDARISFEIGRTLLDHMDSDGIDALEATIKNEPGYTLMVCQILTRYYTRTGDNRSAQTCRRRALAYQVDAA